MQPSPRRSFPTAMALCNATAVLLVVAASSASHLATTGDTASPGLQSSSLPGRICSSSLIQAGVTSSKGFLEEDAAGRPLAQAHGATSGEGVATPTAPPRQRGLVAGLLEEATRIAKAAPESLDLPDPLVSTYLLGVMVFLILASFAMVIRPEVQLYHVASTGCTLTGLPIPSIEGLLETSVLKEQLAPLASAWGEAPRLCEELLVPSGCFCTVVVPLKPTSADSLNVTSMDGTLLLRVLVHAEAREPWDEPLHEAQEALSGQGRKVCRPLFALTTRQGVVLARCTKVAPPQRGQLPGFRFEAADGEHSASFVFREKQYHLSGEGGACARFWGTSDFSTINVSANTGKQVARIQMCRSQLDPTGEYCCLRSSPGVDAGTMIMCLLCINHVGNTAR